MRSRRICIFAYFMGVLSRETNVRSSNVQTWLYDIIVKCLMIFGLTFVQRKLFQVLNSDYFTKKFLSDISKLYHNVFFGKPHI